MSSPLPESYIVVRTRETGKVDRALGFSVQGFTEHYAQSYPLAKGDKLAVYFAKPVKGFVATVEITGPPTSSTDRLWAVDDSDELFPVRYPSRPRVVVSDEDALPFADLIDELRFASNLKNPVRWGMLVIRAIRRLPARDFEIIEQRLERRRRRTPSRELKGGAPDQ